MESSPRRSPSLPQHPEATLQREDAAGMETDRPPGSGEKPPLEETAAPEDTRWRERRGPPQHGDDDDEADQRNPVGLEAVDR